MSSATLALPSTGSSKKDVLAAMRTARDHDIKWQQGRAFGLVYHINEEIDLLLKEAYTMFFSENGLNPTAFPSIRKFESEVLAMTASLLGGDENVCGNMTTGGTESLLMAVKTARDWARQHHPEITQPEVVLPVTAHPAFEKAAEYFDVRLVQVPVRSDYRADVEAMRRAITPNTILVVGSAPSYPHGVIDPIRELAALAQGHGLLFHTDACVGGFLLPFARKLGYPIPDFDFSVPGVTSISADLHKFGYAAKPASVILYRSPELRRHQMFVSINWPGGIYPSPTMTGSRAAGPIAAAWALMNHLGEAGYLKITQTVMETTRILQDGIRNIPGLKILSNPEMSVFAIASDSLDVYEVADELELRGWHLDRQHFPRCLHVTVNHVHSKITGEFLDDLAAAAAIVRKPSFRKTSSKFIIAVANLLARLLPRKWMSALMEKVSSMLGGSGSGLPSRMAPMYGLIGSLPNRGDIKELVLDLLDSMTRLSN
ncbi:MAG: sphingosine-1-phosphate lyase [Chloroflexi bacterium GWB2_49_20]|nr:MAG: sphingosine-1-phosphate lyase [Chloroflexi bacterium GWB2_49_20]OGN77933.1 MAG: sphingosine-1-phosphate lyase [Chloroflexi bacterium GWC2_49_37]OGN84971.1 MAG: sphingosine-1-phosphate lyase [Chloroflexi bacterium GWD2_49_16]HBG75000.1 aspartate aminotransferase family protein [Anaerolineae bacterium]HCC79749.1 aspartate aminotransferase family protein [Anaerolineae bacterium]